LLSTAPERSDGPEIFSSGFTRLRPGRGIQPTVRAAWIGSTGAEEEERTRTQNYLLQLAMRDPDDQTLLDKACTMAKAHPPVEMEWEGGALMADVTCAAWRENIRPFIGLPIFFDKPIDAAHPAGRASCRDSPSGPDSRREIDRKQRSRGEECPPRPFEDSHQREPVWLELSYTAIAQTGVLYGPGPAVPLAQARIQ
jgi:hypothetical protein